MREGQKCHMLGCVVSRSCIGALSHLWFSHMQVDTRHSWHTGAELTEGSRGVSHLHPHLLFKKRMGWSVGLLLGNMWVSQ